MENYFTAEVEPSFISVGCNRVVHAASWGPSDLLAFGAHHSVAICDPKLSQILITLPGHSDRVNCVEWIPKHKFLPFGIKLPCELILVSGSADGSLILWTHNTLLNKWKLQIQITAHDASISCISALLLSNSQAIIATCSSDSSVKIWNLSISSDPVNYELSLKQVIPVGRMMMETVSISVLDYILHSNSNRTETLGSVQTSELGSEEVNEKRLGLNNEKEPNLNSISESKSKSEFCVDFSPLILAMAGLDNTIHVLTSSNAKSNFHPSCKLKGHQDWIRSLDFCTHVSPSQGAENDKKVLFLASSSQDRTVRIWKIFPKKENSLSKNTSLHGMIGEFSKLGMYASRQVFEIAGSFWEASLETLLVGHEDWVHTVQWHPPIPKRSDPHASWHADVDDLKQPMSMLSASMDRTMLIWRLDESCGIWSSEVAVGEMSHSSLGFYGGVWSADGDAVLAYGHGGALHMWQKVNREDSVLDESASNEVETELGDTWQPVAMPSGHFGPVQDVCWDKTCHFLMSASQDQTIRIFARWNQSQPPPSMLSWHEIARPQIHGHDFNCAVFVREKVNAKISARVKHVYVSGADEKVMRVFESPDTFLDSLTNTWGGEMYREKDKKEENDKIGDSVRTELRVLGANMSALGLSQKPIYENRDFNRDTNRPSDLDSTRDSMALAEEEPEDADVARKDDMHADVAVASPRALLDPPLEEHLSQNTLWPEMHKLYGHGNELFAMAADHSGMFIASACKAQSASVASIWIWDLLTWQSVGQLEAHNLTVTQMEFSPCDNFLVSVSRDRHLAVFKRVPDWTAGQVTPPYHLLTKIETHKRIIWSISFSFFENIFVTASRDKTVKLWQIADENEKHSVRQLKTLPVFKVGVTAVSFSPPISPTECLLAVGLEDGKIRLWKLSVCKNMNLDGPILNKFLEFDPFLCHVASVKRLAWKLSENVGVENESFKNNVVKIENFIKNENGLHNDSSKFSLLLASCSEDHSVRLFDVILSKNE